MHRRDRMPLSFIRRRVSFFYLFLDAQKKKVGGESLYKTYVIVKYFCPKLF